MQEAESLLFDGSQPTKEGANALKQVEGTDDVRLDELAGPVDRTVHMALCGKVDDGTRLVLRQKRIDAVAVTDVATHENVPHIVLQRAQVFEVAGIGQLVEVYDALIRRASQSSTKLAPIKPAPPVTRMVMVLSLNSLNQSAAP
jgi:hypothetical protein